MNRTDPQVRASFNRHEAEEDRNHAVCDECGRTGNVNPCERCGTLLCPDCMDSMNECEGEEEDAE